MPMMLEWQRQIFASFQAQSSGAPQTQPFFGPFLRIFENLLAPPPGWFTPFCIGLGVILTVISALYVFSSIWLLLLKPAAPRLLCMALAASIVGAFVKLIGFTVARGIWGLATGSGSIFGVIIDGILLAVVLAHRGEWSNRTVETPSYVEK